MLFKQLVQHLEERLGHHQVPTNAHAKTLNDILGGCAVHHDFLMTALRAIYKSNRCQKIDDTVARAPTLAAIEPLRLAVLHNPHTDIDLYRFMEDLCAQTEMLLRDGSEVSRNAGKSSADVIELPRAPRGRIKSWA